MLEKYRGIATTAMRGVNRPRSTHSRSTLVGSKTPTRSTADADDVAGAVPHPRRQSTTPQRRLTPIDKRHRNRSAKKRRGRRPEATEVTSQYGGQDGGGNGGGGPKFRVTSGGRRGRLRPLLSRRTRLEMAQMIGAESVPPPPGAKPEVKPTQNARKAADVRTETLERGTTFTSAVVVPEVSVEGCCPASPFQLRHLPLCLPASNSGLEMELRSPPSMSSETRTPHFTAATLLRQSQKSRAWKTAMRSR